jgi:hypothetical protein
MHGCGPATCEQASSASVLRDGSPICRVSLLQTDRRSVQAITGKPAPQPMRSTPSWSIRLDIIWILLLLGATVVRFRTRR